MKKIFILVLFLSFIIPTKAQYLLEENDKKVEKEKKEKKKDKEEIFKTYDVGDDATIKKGYRGFGDFGIGFSSTTNVYGENYNTITFSTSHGYQLIEDYLFIGGGIGYWYMYNCGRSVLPLFADVRSDFYSFGKWSLFSDLKLGYSVMDQTGFYLDPQIGVRYSLNNKLGLNLGIAYQFFKDNDLIYEDGEGLGYFAVKIGVDF